MEQQQHLERRLDEIEVKMDKMLTVLTGNQIVAGDTGIVGRMAAQEARIEKLERWKDRVIYGLVGAGIAGGWTLSDLINKIFHH